MPGSLQRGSPAQAALDQVGEDTILGLVADGATIGRLGKRFGVSRRTFYNWINAVEGRRAKLEEAKRQAAEALIDEADEELDHATPENIQVVKERVTHKRFKASKLDRDTWGDRPAQVNVGISLSDLHLDALRQYGRMTASEPPTLPAEVVEDDG